MIGARCGPAFCICRDGDEDQLFGNSTADPRLCFRCADSTTPLLPNIEFQALAVFCDRTAQLVQDLVGNPEQRGSLFHAHGNEQW